MDSTTVTTIWYARLAAAQAKNSDYTPDAHSTLNEHFGVEQNTPLAAGEIPELNYLAIGRGGHRNVTSNGASLTDTLQHRIDNACLFEHIPFVLREVNNDLTAPEREKYRMRRLETHNGVDYFAYYVKPLVRSSSSASIEIMTTTGNTVTTEPYVPSIQQLNPQPVSSLNSTGKHLVVRDGFNIVLSNEEIQEIINACTIIYNDSRYAAISELAVCSGFERQISSTLGGVAASYKEIIASQVCSFLPGEHKSLIYQSQEIDISLNAGNGLPWIQ